MEIGECRWLRERTLGCALTLPPIDCSLRAQRLLVGKHACTHTWKYSKLSIILINNSSKTSFLWNKMVTSSEKRWPLHSLLTSKQLIFSKMHSTRASGSLGLRTATDHRVKLPLVSMTHCFATHLYLYRKRTPAFLLILCPRQVPGKKGIYAEIKVIIIF